MGISRSSGDVKKSSRPDEVFGARTFGTSRSLCDVEKPSRPREIFEVARDSLRWDERDLVHDQGSALRFCALVSEETVARKEVPITRSVIYRHRTTSVLGESVLTTDAQAQRSLLQSTVPPIQTATAAIGAIHRGFDSRKGHFPGNTAAKSFLVPNMSL